MTSMFADKAKLKAIEVLVDEIADDYDYPSEDTVKKFCQLTGRELNAEDVYMYCCEYYSHHSLEETVYALLTGEYPEQDERSICFWKDEGLDNVPCEDIWISFRLGAYSRGENPEIVNNVVSFNTNEITESFKSIDGYTLSRTRDSEDMKFVHFDRCKNGEYGFKYHISLTYYADKMLKVTFTNVDSNIREHITHKMLNKGFRSHIPEK